MISQRSLTPVRLSKILTCRLPDMQWPGFPTHVIAAVVLMLLTSTAVAASLLEAIETPSDATRRWVSPNINHNGVTYEVQRVVSPRGIDDVLEFYRTLWRAKVPGGEPAYVENTVGQWSTIGKLQAGVSVVLQLKKADRGGVEGFLSAYRLSPQPVALSNPVDIPMFSGSEVVSRTATSDLSVHSLTVISRHSASVSAQYGFYRDVMPRNGWVLTTGTQTEEAAVLLYSKSNAQSEISISRSAGSSVVVINRTTTRDRP